MAIFGVPTVDFLAIFIWIPVWWAIALFSLYMMRRHDEEKARRRADVNEVEG